MNESESSMTGSEPQRPIKVLVVDDSVVIRRLVSDVLDSDPRIDVVGTAQNGQVALAKLMELKPDAITLDVEMPVMDGIECLRQLRQTHPRLPVVMFSTLTERGASATLDALAAGASDYVTKPANVGSVGEGRQNIADQLIPKLIALTGARRTSATAPAPIVPPVPAQAGPPRAGGFGVLAIGCSTGGPDALATMLRSLPAALPVPVVIVQHMPALFTRMLAQRLDNLCPLTVTEAVEGDVLQRGRVLLAPGGRHLELATQGSAIVAHLSDAPPENFCRPSVDVMFRSVAAAFRNRTLGVILTGMGRDGVEGATSIRRDGGEIVVQDEASSVVWGMPGATVQAGQADQVVGLDAMAARVAGMLGREGAGSAHGSAAPGPAAAGSTPAGSPGGPSGARAWQ